MSRQANDRRALMQMLRTMEQVEANLLRMKQQIAEATQRMHLLRDNSSAERITYRSSCIFVLIV